MNQFGDKFLITEQGVEFQKLLGGSNVQPIVKNSLHNSAFFGMSQSNANLSQHEQDLQKMFKSEQVENHLKNELSQNNDSVYVNRLISQASLKVIKARGQTLKQLQLPVLDFRQREILKHKNTNSLGTLPMKNSIIIQQGQDNIGKMVAATLYHIEKIDRIVKKYSTTNKRKQSQPLNQNIDEANDPNEGMTTLRKRYSKEIKSLNKNEEYQERYKQLISEIHAKSYKKKWENLYVPKKFKNDQ